MPERIEHTYQFKRGTAKRLFEVNPLLAEGEPAFETDTHLLKIGDGFAPYNTLPYTGFRPIQSNWSQNNSAELDYIKNKTHFIIDIEDIEWIDNGEILNEYDDGLNIGYYQKVSNFVPAPDVLIGSKYTFQTQDSIQNIEEKDIIEDLEKGMLMCGYSAVSVEQYHKAAIIIVYNSDKAQAPQGIYFNGGFNINEGNYIYVSTLTFPKVKKLDIKYLPIDQTYDSESENPQSGKAISEPLNNKQDVLVSGHNIKTVNGESILGNGNIEIQLPIDQIFNANSTNAQSGQAIAKKLNNYILKGYETTTEGEYSHAEGRWTIAKGDYSHAEGDTTKANGDSSHAEGYQTIANSASSHVEGLYTQANGGWAHAEGETTNANGVGSHAEGRSTESKGDYSHAEGLETKALCDYSHTEGYRSIAKGLHSHAEGHETYAAGDDSHSEGYWASAKGKASHAEGHSTQALGEYSHAEGNNTRAESNFSHAEGYQTITKGKSSHAEGNGAQANSDSSHAGGWDTRAEGVASFAHGAMAQAWGQYSAAFGDRTIANEDNQFVIGILNANKKDTLFEVGNGDEYQLITSNAFAVYKDGSVEIGNEKLTSDMIRNIANIENILDELHNYAQVLIKRGEE